MLNCRGKVELEFAAVSCIASCKRPPGAAEGLGCFFAGGGGQVWSALCRHPGGTGGGHHLDCPWCRAQTVAVWVLSCAVGARGCNCKSQLSVTRRKIEAAYVPVCCTLKRWEHCLGEQLAADLLCCIQRPQLPYQLFDAVEGLMTASAAQPCLHTRIGRLGAEFPRNKHPTYPCSWLFHNNCTAKCIIIVQQYV